MDDSESEDLSVLCATSFAVSSHGDALDDITERLDQALQQGRLAEEVERYRLDVQRAANYCLFKLAALTPDATAATEGDGGAGAAGPEGPAAPAAPTPAAAATASASASTARQLAADAAAKGLRQLISHPILRMLVDWEPQLRVLAQIVERVKVTEVLAAALEVFGQLVTAVTSGRRSASTDEAKAAARVHSRCFELLSDGAAAADAKCAAGAGAARNADPQRQTTPQQARALALVALRCWFLSGPSAARPQLSLEQRAQLAADVTTLLRAQVEAAAAAAAPAAATTAAGEGVRGGSSTGGSAAATATATATAAVPAATAGVVDCLRLLEALLQPDAAAADAAEPATAAVPRGLEPAAAAAAATVAAACSAAVRAGCLPTLCAVLRACDTSSSSQAVGQARHHPEQLQQPEAGAEAGAYGAEVEAEAGVEVEAEAADADAASAAAVAASSDGEMQSPAVLSLVQDLVLGCLVSVSHIIGTEQQGPQAQLLSAGGPAVLLPLLQLRALPQAAAAERVLLVLLWLAAEGPEAQREVAAAVAEACARCPEVRRRFVWAAGRCAAELQQRRGGRAAVAATTADAAADADAADQGLEVLLQLVSAVVRGQTGMAADLLLPAGGGGGLPLVQAALSCLGVVVGDGASGGGGGASGGGGALLGSCGISNSSARGQQQAQPPPPSTPPSATAAAAAPPVAVTAAALQLLHQLLLHRGPLLPHPSLRPATPEALARALVGLGGDATAVDGSGRSEEARRNEELRLCCLHACLMGGGGGGGRSGGGGGGSGAPPTDGLLLPRREAVRTLHAAVGNSGGGVLQRVADLVAAAIERQQAQAEEGAGFVRGDRDSGGGNDNGSSGSGGGMMQPLELLQLAACVLDAAWLAAGEETEAAGGGSGGGSAGSARGGAVKLGKAGLRRAAAAGAAAAAAACVGARTTATAASVAAAAVRRLAVAVVAWQHGQDLMLPSAAVPTAAGPDPAAATAAAARPSSAATAASTAATAAATAATAAAALLRLSLHGLHAAVASLLTLGGGTAALREAVAGSRDAYGGVGWRAPDGRSIPLVHCLVPVLLGSLPAAAAAEAAVASCNSSGSSSGGGDSSGAASVATTSVALQLLVMLLFTATAGGSYEHQGIAAWVASDAYLQVRQHVRGCYPPPHPAAAAAVWGCLLAAAAPMVRSGLPPDVCAVLLSPAAAAVGSGGMAAAGGLKEGSADADVIEKVGFRHWREAARVPDRELALTVMRLGVALLSGGGGGADANGTAQEPQAAQQQAQLDSSTGNGNSRAACVALFALGLVQQLTAASCRDSSWGSAEDLPPGFCWRDDAGWLLEAAADQLRPLAPRLPRPQLAALVRALTMRAAGGGGGYRPLAGELPQHRLSVLLCLAACVGNPLLSEEDCWPELADRGYGALCGLVEEAIMDLQDANSPAVGGAGTRGRQPFQQEADCLLLLLLGLARRLCLYKGSRIKQQQTHKQHWQQKKRQQRKFGSASNSTSTQDSGSGISCEAATYRAPQWQLASLMLRAAALQCAAATQPQEERPPAGRAAAAAVAPCSPAVQAAAAPALECLAMCLLAACEGPLTALYGRRPPSPLQGLLEGGSGGGAGSDSRSMTAAAAAAAFHGDGEEEHVLALAEQVHRATAALAQHIKMEDRMTASSGASSSGGLGTHASAAAATSGQQQQQPLQPPSGQSLLLRAALCGGSWSAHLACVQQQAHEARVARMQWESQRLVQEMERREEEQLREAERREQDLQRETERLHGEKEQLQREKEQKEKELQQLKEQRQRERERWAADCTRMASLQKDRDTQHKAEVATLRSRLKWAFLQACLEGDATAVKKMLDGDAGVDVDVKDGNGHTGLYFAARRGHLEVVELLIEKGANVNLPCGKSGQTPLEAARDVGYGIVVRALMKARGRQ